MRNKTNNLNSSNMKKNTVRIKVLNTRNTEQWTMIEIEIVWMGESRRMSKIVLRCAPTTDNDDNDDDDDDVETKKKYI